ncbi:helix-turn-helix domain-containing protein [Pontibacillus salipaludis]|uniref:Helix-turn-helix domain-containing protein n=1 Tax=Pontibacillus salipaludis TaxID=1697394 RepID=A0ABQ1PZV8_9BACI|nr:hypothetical protein [Pontibacillus salipaludis]GGD07805.1 hypothetical protein GCM10011389_14170 [Pontibacillus salipaludis]
MSGEKLREVFDKRNPRGANDDRHFIALPSDALHYVHHVRMSAEKFFLYQLIIDHYNPKDGYAYPSIERLSVMYSKTPETTSKHLDDLKEVGLIDFPEKGYYVPLVPLDAETFYGEHPDALRNYKDRLKKSEGRRLASAERMQKWRAEQGYSNG